MSPRISPRHDLCFKSEMKVSNGSRVGLLPSCQPDHSGGPVVRAEECCRLPGLRVELLDKTLNFRKRLPGGEELRLPALPGHEAPLRLGDLGFPKVETELFARLGERLSDGFDSYRLIFMGSALIADLGGSPPIRSAHRNPDELHLHSASEVERDLLRSEASGANERHQEARTEISCEPGGEISGWHWIERVLYQQFHDGKNQNQGTPGRCILNFTFRIYAAGAQTNAKTRNLMKRDLTRNFWPPSPMRWPMSRPPMPAIGSPLVAIVLISMLQTHFFFLGAQGPEHYTCLQGSHLTAFFLLAICCFGPVNRRFFYVKLRLFKFDDLVENLFE